MLPRREFLNSEFWKGIFRLRKCLKSLPWNNFPLTGRNGSILFLSWRDNSLSGVPLHTARLLGGESAYKYLDVLNKAVRFVPGRWSHQRAAMTAVTDHKDIEPYPIDNVDYFLPTPMSPKERNQYKVSVRKPLGSKFSPTVELRFKAKRHPLTKAKRDFQFPLEESPQILLWKLYSATASAGTPPLRNHRGKAQAKPCPRLGE